MAITWSKVPQTVLDLASGIIEAYHPDLLDARIGFVFRSEAQTGGGKQVWGQAQKVNDKLKVYLDFDFLIWLAADIWGSLSLNQKKALIDHELCHCLWDEGRTSLRPHDIEEFTEIVDRYGLWRIDLEKMAKSMKTAQPGQAALWELPPKPHKQGAVLSVEVQGGLADALE